MVADVRRGAWALTLDSLGRHTPPRPTVMEGNESEVGLPVHPPPFIFNSKIEK